MAVRPRLLVLRSLGLGDVLTVVPALRALRMAFPDHELVLAAPGPLGHLARQLGLIDCTIPADGLRSLPALADRPELAVNLHGQGPQSHRLLLDCRPARLIAFAHDDVPAAAGQPRWTAHEHEVHRWCRLLSEVGIPACPADLEIEVPSGAGRLSASYGGGGLGATVVHPGAGSAARRWPVDRWAAVAASEAGRGRPVVVTGNRHERRVAEAVARRAGLPADAVVAGTLSLLALAALVAGAGRVVCCDTGIAHLATAVGTPSVVLFGPTSPEEWGPPPDRPWHVVLWRGSAAGDPHGARIDPGLDAIAVEDVEAALAHLPTARPSIHSLLPSASSQGGTG